LTLAAATRSFLRKRLSPEAYQQYRTRLWHCRYYWPRRIGSVSIHRFPTVYGPASDFTKRISAVNVFASTKMCSVMTRYGSDKGSGWHNYTTIYSALFSGLHNSKLAIFELGLGTNNPSLPSSMRDHGLPGGSLRGWRELFPSSLVFGADIDRSCLFHEDRIQTFYCDQLDEQAIAELWAQPPLQAGMDIIVDDGLHTFDGNISFIGGSLQHIRANGTYVVEDILGSTFERWLERLPKLVQQFPDFDFALVKMPDVPNKYDNNMLFAQRNR
jgi:hypothetical protein